MDFYVTFPVSGVRASVFVPPLIAFAVSLFASMGGVSGAFLLLPFQVSFLHFVSPSVSSTNFVYNVVAIPSGVYRYIREGRMVWPLAGMITLGTLPGVLLGYYIRVLYLPNPNAFKLFVGCVLVYVGARLLREVAKEFFGPANGNRAGGNNNRVHGKVRTVTVSLDTAVYEFEGGQYTFGTAKILVLSFIVGIVGGAYGIGGGSIIAPFCVALFNLPVYTVAGAALLGTFLTSIAGVFFYSVVPAKTGFSTAPDWPLGILFGLGGTVGMYCGARLQRFVPQKLIKTTLAVMLLFLAVYYVIDSFRRGAP
jgi:uncharacterized protein